MDGGHPRTVEGFDAIRTWMLGHGQCLGRVVPGPVGAAIVVERPRATVAIVDATEASMHAQLESDLLIVAGPPAALDEALVALPGRHVQLLPLPCPLALVEHTVTAAMSAADAYAGARMAEQLLDIGIALNAERDPARVLELILQHARKITNADAGSIYVVDEDAGTLTFKIAQNDSVAADFSEFTMPITDSSIVGAAVLAGKTVRIPDLYVEGGPVALGRRFNHDRSFDERFGYQTRSMITTPMIAPEGKVLAVIQLINARTGRGPLRQRADFDEQVRPFTEQDERLCSALASQAAVALESARLYAEIEALFEGFVRASVHAIEQRDPTTSGHSQRVADLTVALARAADRADDGPFASTRFDREQLRELQYAGLLHDFGKVGVREEVLVKAKKLYDHELELVVARFEHMRTVLQLELLQAQLQRARAGQGDDPALVARHEARLRELEQALSLVLEANEPSVMPQDVSQRLAELTRVVLTDPSGRTIQPVGPREVEALTIRRGSLTDSERVEIQDHVTHTYNFLVRIPWGQSLAQVPEIAGKHHEYLDGSGYPSRTRAEQIPLQTRMMTVSDIFDALTASDRPYKRAVPATRALEILEHDVEAGKLDPDVLGLFIGAKVFATLDDTPP